MLTHEFMQRYFDMNNTGCNNDIRFSTKITENWRYAHHIRVLIAYSNLEQDWQLQWIQSECTVRYELITQYLYIYIAHISYVLYYVFL